MRARKELDKKIDAVRPAGVSASSSSNGSSGGTNKSGGSSSGGGGSGGGRSDMGGNGQAHSADKAKVQSPW